MEKIPKKMSKEGSFVSFGLDLCCASTYDVPRFGVLAMLCRDTTRCDAAAQRYTVTSN